MSEYKQILEDWYWNKGKNLLVHKCSRKYGYNTQQIDSKIKCNSCKEEAPQEIADVCLLCNIRPQSVYKTIEGKWKVEEHIFDSKPNLTHWCKGEAFPYYRISTQCGWCKTKAPEHIIKYCKENNVRV